MKRKIISVRNLNALDLGEGIGNESVNMIFCEKWPKLVDKWSLISILAMALVITGPIQKGPSADH